MERTGVVELEVIVEIRVAQVALWFDVSVVQRRVSACA